MVLYVVDRLYGMFWYRATNETKLICKYNIDKDYVILFLHVPGLDEIKDKDTLNEKQYLGDVYWLNTKKFVEARQFAHPFTTFYNHSNELYANIEQSLLFSSAMRHTISHRGHRFPIRTHSSHNHVLSPEMGKARRNLDLLRTETALSGMITLRNHCLYIIEFCIWNTNIIRNIVEWIKITRE